MRDQWRFDLEKLFYDYKVDIIFEAHQHSYERLWPMYNGTVLNGSLTAPYTNPRGPVRLRHARPLPACLRTHPDCHADPSCGGGGRLR
jgi:hypothetical protein